MSPFMVKYVCYDILKLEMFSWHIYCNKNYIWYTCISLSAKLEIDKKKFLWFIVVFGGSWTFNGGCETLTFGQFV